MFDFKELLKNKYFYYFICLWGGLLLVFPVVLGFLRFFFRFFLHPLILYPILDSYFYICCFLFFIFNLIFCLKMFRLLLSFNKIVLEQPGIIKSIFLKIIEKITTLYSVPVRVFNVYLFEKKNWGMYYSVKYSDILELLFIKKLSLDIKMFNNLYLFILYFPTVVFLCVLCVEVILYNQIYYSYFFLVFMIINRLVRFFLSHMEIYLPLFFDSVIKEFVLYNEEEDLVKINFESKQTQEYFDDYQVNFCQVNNITKEMCDGDVVWHTRLVSDFEDKYLFFYKSVYEHIILLHLLLKTYNKHIVIISFIRVLIFLFLVIYVVLKNIYFPIL